MPWINVYNINGILKIGARWKTQADAVKNKVFAKHYQCTLEYPDNLTDDEILERLKQPEVPYVG